MTKLTIVKFFSTLRFFLPEDHKNGIIKYSFKDSPSVKDAIESLGIPHTEVALICFNDEYVDFSFQLQGGESLEVYPYHYPCMEGVSPLSPLMPSGRPSFIADVHLGRLARFIRVSGFDTIYEKDDMGDEAIAHIAAKDNRIVLTRDVGLLKRSIVNFGYILRSSNSRQQFNEVVKRYYLKSLFLPFSRCVHCNGYINKIEKKEVERSLPEGIRRDFEEFYICSECSHVYWEGSHYKRINDLLESF